MIKVRAKRGDEVVCVPPTGGRDWFEEYWGKKGTVVSVGGDCSRSGKCNPCLGGGEMEIKLKDGSLTTNDCWGYDYDTSGLNVYYAWKLLVVEEERARREYVKEIKKLFVEEFERSLHYNE